MLVVLPEASSNVHVMRLFRLDNLPYKRVRNRQLSHDVSPDSFVMNLHKREFSSKIKLDSLPLSAHDSAAGAAASHRCITWLDGDHGTADDLSHAITADATNALGASESVFQQPRPPAAGAEDLQ